MNVNNFTVGTTIASADVNENFSDIASAINSGWIPADQSWAYASANTITVPSGATAIYSVGDKIKITQTTVKYFYVTAVADTTLTVTGGTDYTVANAAITENYYSKAASPVGFPGWFSWTPVWSGFSVNPTTVARFMLEGSKVTVCVRASSTGTSNANTLTLTAPLTSKTIANMAWVVIPISIDNSSASATADFCLITSNSSTIVAYKAGSTAGWTASGGKSVSFTLTYEI